MKKQILKVGFDLDGVLLYNPARIIRPIISFIKKLFAKKKELNFYLPATYWEKQLWRFFHKSSIFIAPGLDDIKKLIRTKKIKAYIITARYSYLKNDLDKWLKKMKINQSFSGVYYNQKDEQPHLFKERMIKKLNIDIFVEDNWDIVNHLNNQQLVINYCKIFWIYNIFDRNKAFQNKFPGLNSVIIKIKKIIE